MSELKNNDYLIMEKIIINTLNREIDEHVYNDFINSYKRYEKSPLTIEITTSGRGYNIIYALMIANVIALHSGKTIAYIPRYCLGMGTLIALMCSEIQMASYAFLGVMEPTILGVDLKCLKTTFATINNKNFEEPSFLQLFTNSVSSYLTELDIDCNKKIHSLLKRKYSKQDLEELELFFRKSKTTTQYPLSYDELPEFLAIKKYENEVVPEITSSKDVSKNEIINVNQNVLQEVKLIEQPAPKVVSIKNIETVPNASISEKHISQEKFQEEFNKQYGNKSLLPPSFRGIQTSSKTAQRTHR